MLVRREWMHRVTVGEQLQRAQALQVASHLSVAEAAASVRVSRLVQRYQNTLIYYHSFISIGRVNLLVILISHWVGCLFGMTHDWDDDTSKSRRWLLAVYWAVQSITSVGYGDIPAENSLFADFVHLYHAHRCGARELDHDERAVGDESGFLGSTFSRAFAVCARVPQEQPAPFGGGKTRNHVLPVAEHESVR